MNSKKSLIRFGAAVLVYFATLPAAYSFPLNAPNARTLFGGFSLGVADFRFTRETGAGQELNVSEETLTGVYGATRDLTLGVTLPIVQKHLEFSTSSGTKTIRSSGLGDLSLVGVYRFYRRDVSRATTQFSLIGGVKAPTGSTSQSDRDAPLLPGNNRKRLPKPLQPGSGSWDGVLGVAAFQNLDRLSFYGSVQGKINSEHDNFRFGNNLHYDFTVDYVTLQERNLFFVLELNGISSGRNEENGRNLRNSGGHTLFVSPGVEYLPLPYVILESSVQIPIVQDSNGRQPEKRVSLVFGVRYLF
ncbi:MAG: transporter [Deltaproteobacteria bacterium]|nr:transporter [Deltaproteobacteria bacterium]